MAQEPETTVAVEKPADEGASVPVPEAEEVKTATPPAAEDEVVAGEDVDVKEKEKAVEELVGESASFKEESNRVADLSESEKKALEELKVLVKEALEKHELSADPPKPEPPVEPAKAEPAAEEPPKTEEPPTTEEPPVKTDEGPSETTEEPPKATEEPPKATEEPPKAKEESTKVAEEPPKSEAAEETEEVVVVTTVESVIVGTDDDGAKTVEAIEETVVAVAPAGDLPAELAEELAKTPEVVEIWGVPLLADERSDVVLLKFLRARDFKVKDAFTMIKNTVRWRKEFGIDALLGEDLGSDLDSVVFTSGVDKEGHPVCYNVYGEFLNKELYDKTFGDAEKRQKFLRWRIQFLEKSIQRQLNFEPSGISTFVQVMDLKNSPGPGKRELRQATNQALSVLQDNYPEFAAKQIFINVPWWYLAFNRMLSPFLTQRSRSKFVFAGPSKSSETLFKYIAPEQVPVQYGGLSRGETDGEFSVADPITEVTVKPTSKHVVELPVTEKSTLAWELRVPGWDVSYGAEFVPSSQDSYTIIIQKLRKLSTSDEHVVKTSFKPTEPGTVVLTVDNTTSKKKKLLYRTKT